MPLVLALTGDFVKADTASAPSAKELVELLRAGGYSLYFRHEATDWSQSDNITSEGDWLSCDGNQVRQLSNSGRERSATTGKVIRSLGIPVGKILASPYCRTMETARLMNLGTVVPSTTTYGGALRMGVKTKP